MPVLSNPRWEQFALAIASGRNPVESYVSLGYKPDAAQKSANRLSKVASVKARIEELCEMAAKSSAQQSWLHRTFLLEKAKEVLMLAIEEKQLAAANTTLKMMGQEIGVFVEKTEQRFVWNGDPSALDDKQLEQLTNALERIAYGENEARVREERRRVLAEGGAIAASFEVVEGPKADAPESANLVSVEQCKVSV